MQYLRLYLVIKYSPDNLETRVHRDFEPLLEEWRNAKKEKNATSLIHIGFDCPLDKSIIALLDKYPQRTLITESARWALPCQYSVFPLSIGACDFYDTRNPIPVYLGTEGWESGSTNEDIRKIIEGQLIIENTVGWLKDLLEDNPELFLRLAKKGVVNDESYNSLRERISEDEWLETERIKLHYLKGRVNKNNLWDLLKIAPKKVLNANLADLELSVRLANIFRDKNIIKVEDLKKYNEQSLMDFKNLGRKSLDILTGVIWNAIDSFYEEPRSVFSHEDAARKDEAKAEEKPRKDEAKAKEEQKKDRLISILADELSRFNERERAIFQSRLGYEGSKITLEQIGQRYKITRERVRQIESKIMRGIKRRIGKRLAAKIDSILCYQKDPLDLEFLELEDRWFEGFLGRYEYLASIIESFSYDKFHVIKIRGRGIVSCIAQEEWDELTKRCITQLRGPEILGWTRKEVEILIEALASKNGIPELGRLLKRQTKDKLLFAQEGDTEAYIGYGSPLDMLIRAVLTESDSPLHITEISKRIKQKYEREVELGQITNSASGAGALMLGRGIYGLWKHIALDQNEIEDIISSIEQIVDDDKKGKQWSARELLEKLLEERFDLPEELNMYLIEAILSKSNKLVSLGRFIWANKERVGKTKLSRIDFTRAYESILEQAGKPLTEKELRSKISDRRSLCQNHQIVQKGRLLSLSPGVWGLIDRDVLLTSDQRNKVLDVLADILKERKKAIHLTEIKEFLSKHNVPIPESLSGYTIYRLAQNDPRLKIGIGQLLGLAEWVGFGRMNLREAAREVLSKNKKLHLEVIRERVEGLVERKLSNQQVGSTLQNLGAIYDPDADLWQIQENNKQQEDSNI